MPHRNQVLVNSPGFGLFNKTFSCLPNKSMCTSLFGVKGIICLPFEIIPFTINARWYNQFDLVWFGWVLWHINHCRSFNAKSSLYIYIKYIWFGLVGFLWHINHCRSFNAKSSLYIYIKYIWFGLVGFYAISTIVGYLMPILLYTYILNIYDLVWLGFYGISTIVGHLMPNPLYTYILNIYDLVWLGFIAYQPL